MKPSLERTLFNPRMLVAGWLFSALLAWGGLIASLPGYYFLYIQQHVQMHKTSLQVALSTAAGLASLLTALTSLSLATFLFFRKRGEGAALFVSFYLLFYGFVMCGPLEMVEYMLFHQMGDISYRVQAVVFTPMIMLLLLTFPNGKFSPSWSRWLIPLIFLTPLLMFRLSVNQLNSLTNPSSQLVYSLTIFLVIFVLGAQVYRYLKKSGNIERQQTKIFVFGICAQFVFLIISSLTWFQLPVETQLSTEPAVGGIYSLFWWVSIGILPISLTLAVVRSHLWDIDVVIRRTLVYGFLTATLALVYFSSVVLFQYLIRLFAGHESPVAVVISTLAIAGLFHPLRSRIQEVIDRRFFRSKYNTEQALARFQRSMRERVDLDGVERELTGIVQVTVQPEWTTVWMRRPSKQ